MKRNGWSFTWNDGYAFWPNNNDYCKDVPSTSYCGFQYPGDGVVSYTFHYTGTGTLNYGQSWGTGSVQVKKNGNEIDSRQSRGLSSVTFDFTSGDVLKVVELGNSVINIHQLTLIPSGGSGENTSVEV